MIISKFIFDYIENNDVGILAIKNKLSKDAL